MDVNSGPDVIDQIGSGGTPNVMEPSSGSYGAKAETDRIKQQLNVPGQGAGPAGSRPTPPPPPGMPQGAQPSGQNPGSVPDLLLRPSNRPDVPVSTPLQQGAAPQNVTGAQRRLQQLDFLANSPTTSDVTREWAKDLLQKLASRAR